MATKKKYSEDLSLPEEIKMYGVTIRKMPNGQYFKALKLIKKLPESFMKEFLDGDTDIRLSDMFDIENLAKLIGTLLTVAPSFTIKFLAKLLDIEEKVLEEQLTPAQTIEIVQKFWKINELESFFVQMKSIVGKATTLIGFKTQLPSASKSE